MKVTRKGSAILIEWNTEDPKDVREANEFFNNLTRQGWIAVAQKGASRRLLEFRGEEGKILFLPMVEGG